MNGFTNNYRPISYQPQAAGLAPISGIDYATLGSYGPGSAGTMPDLRVTGNGGSFLDQFTWDNFLDKAGPDGGKGWGGLALGAANSLLSAFMGMKNYGLAKDQFNFQKDSWQKEYDAQKGLTNASLEDRQRRRVAENPSLAQDTASYMAKYGVK